MSSHAVAPPRDVDSDRQYLTFTLGPDLFGIPIDGVREIIEYTEPTAIPLMPAFLRGVINLRGTVVPVVDLLSRFGRAPTSVAHRTCVVITEAEHDGASHPMGILVDAVNEVLAVDRSQLEPRPSFGLRIRSDFVEGILNLGNRFVIALDMKYVLSMEELATVIGLSSHDKKLAEVEQIS